MTSCKSLRKERAVRIAVEIDLVDAQRVEHSSHVVRGKAGTVEIGSRSQIRAAIRNVWQRRIGILLQRLTIYILRRAGAAIVDEKQIAAIHQRMKQPNISRATTRSGVSRPALSRHDRPQARFRRTRPRIILEANRNRALPLAHRLQRPLRRSAISGSSQAVTKLQHARLNRLGSLPRRQRDLSRLPPLRLRQRKRKNK